MATRITIEGDNSNSLYVNSDGSINTKNPKNIIRIDMDGGSNPVYIGEASAGTASSSAYWRIKKITWDVNSNPLSVLFADGNTNYDNIWDNRASLSYS